MKGTAWTSAEATFTPDTAAYSINDSIGGLLTFDFGLTGGLNGGGAELYSMVLADDDNEGAAGALWLFRDVPTTFADNAAFAPVLADLKKVITVITMPTFVTANSLKIGLVTDINDAFFTGNTATPNKIYGYLVPSGTPTYASSKSIYIRLTARLF